MSTEQKTVTHTPGPWDDASKYPGVASVRIFAKTHYIATVGNSDDTREQTEANAAFIVRACNSHADLLAALKALVDETERCDRPGLYGVSSDDHVMKVARAAIAKAEAL